jgi:hypothetical protein
VWGRDLSFARGKQKSRERAEVEALCFYLPTTIGDNSKKLLSPGLDGQSISGVDAQLGIPSPKTPDMEGGQVSNLPGPQVIGLQDATDDGPPPPPRPHRGGDPPKNGFDDITTPQGPEVTNNGEAAKMPSPSGPSISYQPRTGDEPPRCQHGCNRVQMMVPGSKGNLPRRGWKNLHPSSARI